MSVPVWIDIDPDQSSSEKHGDVSRQTQAEPLSHVVPDVHTFAAIDCDQGMEAYLILWFAFSLASSLQNFPVGLPAAALQAA